MYRRDKAGWVWLGRAGNRMVQSGGAAKAGHGIAERGRTGNGSCGAQRWGKSGSVTEWCGLFGPDRLGPERLGGCGYAELGSNGKASSGKDERDWLGRPGLVGTD